LLTEFSGPFNYLDTGALYRFFLFLAFLLVLNFPARRYRKKAGGAPEVCIGWEKIDYFIHFLLFAVAILSAQLAGFIINYFPGLNLFVRICLVTLIFMGVLFFLTVFYLKLKMSSAALRQHLGFIFRLNFLVDGVVDYLRFFPLILVVSVVNFSLLYYFDISWKQTVTYQILMLITGWWEAFLIFLLVVIIAPLVEELFFRGSFFRLLRSSVSASPAAFVSGFIFALIHFEFYYFPVLLLLGYLLGIIYEESKSLAVPVAFHAFHNMLVLVIFYATV